MISIDEKDCNNEKHHANDKIPFISISIQIKLGAQIIHHAFLQKCI